MSLNWTSPVGGVAKAVVMEKTLPKTTAAMNGVLRMR
jgi:hypothetical protein